jgi:lincosamide nucleotidyltransferase A/C/D/E
MKFPGQDVIRTVRLLEEGGVPVWLDGGWGVDALLGRETRVHRDMDLVVPLDCLVAAELVLGEVGFSRDDRETDIPTRLLLRNSEGLEIDIRPVTFKSDGSAVHLDIDKEGAKYAYRYSAAGFSGVGTVNGRVVRCVTAAEQIRQRVRRRYSPWSETRARETGVSADLEDIDSLLQVFGANGGKLGQATTAPESRPSDNAVVEAAEQFCLRHVASLNAQHFVLKAQHAKLRMQHADLCAQHEALTKQCATQHSQLITQRAELIAHINAMRGSTSWRLTAPMRWAVNWLGLDWLKLRPQ